MKGDKIVTKVSPFIVNKAFACEVYLKLLLLEYDIDFSDLKGNQRHNLLKLYTKLTEGIKDKNNDIHLLLKLTITKSEMESISDAFVNWRYIYQYYDKVSELNYVFLNSLCEFLDKLAKQTILSNYNYNVDIDPR